MIHQDDHPSSLSYWLVATTWIICIIGFIAAYLAAFMVTWSLPVQLSMFALPWLLLYLGVTISEHLLQMR